MEQGKRRGGRGLLVVLVAAVLAGCSAEGPGPQSLLGRYFTSAVRQDYGATYECYSRLYREKVARDEYVKRRQQAASVLRDFQVVSVAEKGDTAEAVALLTFAPAATRPQAGAVKIRVTENLVREDGQWKVKVW